MSAADRHFVDSNLLLYYVDPVDSRKQARAMGWLEALWMAGAGCVSWQVLLLIQPSISIDLPVVDLAEGSLGAEFDADDSPKPQFDKHVGVEIDLHSPGTSWTRSSRWSSTIRLQS